MVLGAALWWFAEVDGGCGLYARALPFTAAGEVAELARLPGACEIAAVAPDDEGLLVLLGTWQMADVWRVSPGEVTQLGSSLSLARHVAWTADHTPMVLTAEYVESDQRFAAQTWTLKDDAWIAIEATTEDKDTVRAVEGGPVWQARAPGASVDRWALERAAGFTLAPSDALKAPKFAPDEVLAWGRVPAGAGEIVARYTMLGAPVAAGPVWWHKGKRWKLLDDSRLMETPVSVQEAGPWRLLSYEGAAPVLVDAAKGKVVWRPPEDTWVTGAMLR